MRRVPTRETVGAAVIVVTPLMFAISQTGSSPARDRLELFSLSWSNLMPLLFPLLIGVVFLSRLADEFSNGGTRAVRTRTPLGRFLAVRAARVAAVAFGVFALAVIVSWFHAFVTPSEQLGGLISPPEPGETHSDPSERYRFAGLLNIHPAVFGLFYAAWLGTNAAAYAVLGVAALVWVQNRFVALAVPFIVYLVLTVGPAVVGQESFSSSMAIFPFSLEQVPAWQALPQLFVVAGAALLALVSASWRDYETPGLD